MIVYNKEPNSTKASFFQLYIWYCILKVFWIPPKIYILYSKKVFPSPQAVFRNRPKFLSKIVDYHTVKRLIKQAFLYIDSSYRNYEMLPHLSYSKTIFDGSFLFDGTKHAV